MRKLSMLTCTVELSLYIGEYDDEAQHQRVILKNCYCVENKGVGSGNQGKKPADAIKLYIFDCKTIALSEFGATLHYVPYEQWIETTDKSRIWTLSDKGTDYLQIEGSEQKYKITGFLRKKAGRRRMWHFEVNAR